MLKASLADGRSKCKFFLGEHTSAPVPCDSHRYRPERWKHGGERSTTDPRRVRIKWEEPILEE